MNTPRRIVKIPPNSSCPCFSGKKYKKCCKGEVDWPEILERKSGHVPYISARGRNILFAEAIFDALQLDTDKNIDLSKIKRAVTSNAVRKIHEAVFEIWPPSTDLEFVYSRTSASVAGFYIGDYETDYLEQAVVRHSLYADKILLADPFLHPYVIAPEFNPIQEPEQHRAQTLKNVNRFIRMLPWIDAGLVEFIRTPSDLSRKLAFESSRRASNEIRDSAFDDAMDQTMETLKSRHKGTRSRLDMFFSYPDSHLRRFYRNKFPNNDETEEDKFIQYVQSERDANPDFLETIDKLPSGQLHIMTTGGTIDVAKLTAELAGAYLFTDLKVRWHMLKSDREGLAPTSQVWSPFAKAMQDAKFSFLNAVDLNTALRLRKEERLKGVRSVLRKAWKSELTEDEFDEKNALLIAQNLGDEIQSAQAEWEDIKADIAKFAGLETAGGLLAAGPLIATGHAEWIAGASLAGAAALSGFSQIKRTGFEKRFPASFFMNLDD
jgi:hypothetical protein